MYVLLKMFFFAVCLMLPVFSENRSGIWQALALQRESTFKENLGNTRLLNKGPLKVSATPILYIQ